MNKTRRRNILGMVVYMCIAMLFGGGFGLLAMIVHEDNDRCHYYHGVWNRGLTDLKAKGYMEADTPQ